MSDIAIRVENLSKQYRIGGPQARYKTIRESLTEAVGAPFCRLSSVVPGQSSAVSNETIWALKDVSFEVKRGTRACPEHSEGCGQQKGGAVRMTQVKGEEPMLALRERIVEKLEYLPESNLRQVLSFVEFLTWRATEQDEPLLSVAGILSGKMLSAEEIEEELYGDRKGT